MVLQILLWVYAIIHILVCLVLYLGLRARFFKFSEQVLPMVLLVPVWGLVAAVAADYHSRFGRTGSKAIGLEEMHLGKGDLRLMRMDDDAEGEAIVPLEEAMSINDAETRRKLMLDILHQNPDEYIRLLKQARLDEDIEVTHYASTAIMELQRDLEIGLQKAEREYAEHPERDEALEDCISALKRYIQSGLIEENVLFIHRKRYAELLELAMQLNPGDEGAYLEAVENYLEIGNYGSARFVVDQLCAKWPADENAWFAKLKLCREINDGHTLRETVREIRRRNIYLSPEGKTRLSFWDREEPAGPKV